MKPFRFHRAALAEARDAAEHYAAIHPELGARFYDVLDQLVRDVRTQPTLYRVFDPPARRHFRAPFRMPSSISTGRTSCGSSA